MSDSIEFEGILDALLRDMVKQNVPLLPCAIADALATIFHAGMPEPEFTQHREYLEALVSERAEVMRKEAAGQPRYLA